MYFLRFSFVILIIVKFGSSQPGQGQPGQGQPGQGQPGQPPQQQGPPPDFCADELPRGGCIPAPLTLYERSRFLHNINTFRDLIAGGSSKWPDSSNAAEIETALKGFTGGAKDMEIMHWDDDKARKAQKWANKCGSNAQEQDTCRSKEDEYTNLQLEIDYAGNNETVAMDQLFKKCVTDTTSYTHNIPRGSAQTAQFTCPTAISWGDADAVGCGKVIPSAGKIRMVCAFTPCCWSGATKFTQGAAREQCKHKNPGYSARYRNLCAPPVAGRTNDFYPVSVSLGLAGAILITVLTFLSMRRDQEN